MTIDNNRQQSISINQLILIIDEQSITKFFVIIDYHQLNGLVQVGCKWLFRVKFFSFKSAWIFALLVVEKHSPITVLFVAEMLLFCFAEFIVHTSIFWLGFSQKQSANQARKIYNRMFYYLIEKHMQNFRHFWRQKNFTRKSHLQPSCTKPFNYQY